MVTVIAKKSSSTSPVTVGSLTFYPGGTVTSSDPILGVEKVISKPITTLSPTTTTTRRTGGGGVVPYVDLSASIEEQQRQLRLIEQQQLEQQRQLQIQQQQARQQEIIRASLVKRELEKRQIPQQPFTETAEFSREPGTGGRIYIEEEGKKRLATEKDFLKYETTRENIIRGTASELIAKVKQPKGKILERIKTIPPSLLISPEKTVSFLGEKTGFLMGKTNELTPKERAGLFGLGVATSVAGTIYGAATLPKKAVKFGEDILTKPKETLGRIKSIPSKISRAGESAGIILQKHPEFALGYVAGEAGQIYGFGAVSKAVKTELALSRFEKAPTLTKGWRIQKGREGVDILLSFKKAKGKIMKGEEYLAFTRQPYHIVNERKVLFEGGRGFALGGELRKPGRVRVSLFEQYGRAYKSEGIPKLITRKGKIETTRYLKDIEGGFGRTTTKVIALGEIRRRRGIKFPSGKLFEKTKFGGFDYLEGRKVSVPFVSVSKEEKNILKIISGTAEKLKVSKEAGKVMRISAVGKPKDFARLRTLFLDDLSGTGVKIMQPAQITKTPLSKTFSLQASEQALRTAMMPSKPSKVISGLTLFPSVTREKPIISATKMKAVQVSKQAPKQISFLTGKVSLMERQQERSLMRELLGERTLQKEQQIMKEGLIQREGLLEKQLEKQIMKEGLIQREGLLEKQIEKQIMKEGLIQRERLLEKQIQRLIMKQKLIPREISQPFRGFPVRERIIRFPPPEKIKSEKKLMNDLFGVSVRRRGKFRAIGKGLTLKQAMAFGQSKVERTLAATYRIEGLRDFEKLRTPPYFYKKPSKEGILFIEKIGRRIKRGTPEVSEIQMAKREKKLMKKLLY